MGSVDKTIYNKSYLIGATFFACLLLISISCNQVKPEKMGFSKKHLIQDVNQLADIIEFAHAEPFRNFGSKEAFDKEVDLLKSVIPDTGMSISDFHQMLMPFVAKLGDSHSYIREPSGGKYELGIPLLFDVVDELLYVAAVPDADYNYLSGSKLISVEDILLSELISRQQKLWGSENIYQALNMLGGQNFLFYKKFLSMLLPEWVSKDFIHLKLETTDGVVEDVEFKLPYNTYEFHSNFKTSLQLPDTRKCDFVYEFTGNNKETVIFKIDDMFGYREAFEELLNLGASQWDEAAKDAYKRYKGTEAPEDIVKVIEGLPSFTETMVNLTRDMKENNTKNLIIDIRENHGGNSYMYNILIYFLYGKETLISVKTMNTEIKKYSKYYFEENKNESLKEINKTSDVTYNINSYNYSGDYFQLYRKMPDVKEKVRTDFENYMSKIPTFKKEYDKGDYDAFYLPENVMVTSSSHTFSSAYIMLYYLYRAGAKVVGIPSGQSGNSYGDQILIQLKNTKIKGSITHKKFICFPVDTAMGDILKPDFELTYEKLASYNFDPNATVIYALELIENLKPENKQ